MSGSRSIGRGGALIAALALGVAPVVAHAQPVDPYAPAKAQPAPKAKAPKAKAPKGKGKADGPVDPYADAGAPATPAKPDAPQDPYAQPQPAPGPTPAPAPAPQDPYAAPIAPTPTAPTPTAPTPTPTDEQAVEIDDAVAAALVARAHHLIDVQAWADAKQLAVESLVRSPTGASSADAKDIVRVANQHLGIVESAPPRPDGGEVIEVHPDQGLELHGGGSAVTATAEGPVRGKTALASYGIAGGALLGLGVVGAGDGISTGGEDTAGAIVGGLAGGALGWWLGDRYDATYTQARVVGAGATWGAVEFGLLADAVGGTNVHTTHDEIAVGASIGMGLGTLAGIGYAKDGSLSAGDVTLIDSLAAMGALGGFQVGEIMQPYATEAYSLNSAIGVAGGVIVGLWLAPSTDVSSARLARVDGVAAIGAGAPWLLYALVQDSTSTADERIFGLLSAGGMAAGLYLGFRWTEGYDDQHRDVTTAHRARARSVQLGALGVRPATTSLAPTTGTGVVVDVLRGTW